MQPPNMLRPYRSRETAMLPGMIEMIVGIAPSRIVSDPAIVFRVYVGRGGMPRPVLESSALFALGVWVLLGGSRDRPGGGRAVLWNVPASHAPLMCHARLWGAAVRLASWLSCPFLRPQNVGHEYHQQRGRKAAAFLHTASFSPRSRLQFRDL